MRLGLVQLQFISRGEGIDHQAKTAALLFIGQEDQRNKLTSIKETKKGREGESTLCVEYKELNDYVHGSTVLGRIAWMSQPSLVALNVGKSCDQLASQAEPARQTGPLTTDQTKNEPTLDGQTQPGLPGFPEGYRANLKVTELIRTETNTVEVSYRLLQTATQVRYMEVQGAFSILRLDSAGRMFSHLYGNGGQETLRLTPQSSDREYLGVFEWNGKIIPMNCKS